MCACELSVDPLDPDDDWHFWRTCLSCGTTWRGLHCPHDGYQNPCPGCGLRPTPVPDDEEPKMDCDPTCPVHPRPDPFAAAAEVLATVDNYRAALLDVLRFAESDLVRAIVASREYRLATDAEQNLASKAKLKAAYEHTLSQQHTASRVFCAIAGRVGKALLPREHRHPTGHVIAGEPSIPATKIANLLLRGSVDATRVEPDGEKYRSRYWIDQIRAQPIETPPTTQDLSAEYNRIVDHATGAQTIRAALPPTLDDLIRNGLYKGPA